MNLRKSFYSGSFYPKEKNELIRYIEHFNKCFEVDNIDIKTKAIIVPHAGYIYSGFTANLAYNLSKDIKFKRAVVIGPSHRKYINGASIGLFGEYETPLGNLNVDLEYSMKLKTKYSFIGFDEQCHQEHSTETQAPFLKNYFSDISLVEIVYGDLNYLDLSQVIDEVIKDENNLLIISSDLSHFHNLKDASIIDNISIKAIFDKDLENLSNKAEACGIIGIMALIKISIQNNLITKMLDYRTSYDITKDNSNVVGYTSFLIGERI